MIKGEKVALREARRSDLVYFNRWANDPEVTQYLSIYPPISEKMEEGFLEHISTAAGEAHFVIEAIDGDEPKPIGGIELSGFHTKDRKAMFGIAIFEKDYWSNGYGTEAAKLIIRYGFEQLNLHRIGSYAHAFNERSLRLHLKVGFREEGRQKEAYFRNGAYHDEVMFGLLRKDWEAICRD